MHIHLIICYLFFVSYFLYIFFIISTGYPGEHRLPANLQREGQGQFSWHARQNRRGRRAQETQSKGASHGQCYYAYYVLRLSVTYEGGLFQMINVSIKTQKCYDMIILRPLNTIFFTSKLYSIRYTHSWYRTHMLWL